jgi:hypothetical protein
MEYPLHELIYPFAFKRTPDHEIKCLPGTDFLLDFDLECKRTVDLVVGETSCSDDARNLRDSFDIVGGGCIPDPYLMFRYQTAMNPARKELMETFCEVADEGTDTGTERYYQDTSWGKISEVRAREPWKGQVSDRQLTRRTTTECIFGKSLQYRTCTSSAGCSGTTGNTPSEASSSSVATHTGELCAWASSLWT